MLVETVFPFRLIALAGMMGLLLAVAVAVAPSRAAARTPAALVLRAE